MNTFRLKAAMIFILVYLGSEDVFAQLYPTGSEQNKSGFQWPKGKEMALSLTFDDARVSQVEKGIPLLNRYDVKATFYISPHNLLKKLEGWKKAVETGHEIGNHTVDHPCSGNFEWSRENALEDYTLHKMRAELDSANEFIEKKLGIRPVSFAYPCGQTFVGRGKKTKSYVPLVASMFETGRDWLNEVPNDPAYCDRAKLTAMELDGKSFEEVKKLIESARNKGQWLILAGHEMDEGGAQTSLLSTIEAICKYAGDPANGIWLAPVNQIASFVKEQRGETPFTGEPGDTYIRMLLRAQRKQAAMRTW
ncbi:MAG: polysaccharide deacetylase family protein [Bacteroidota bacterium]